jgi:hypothetical protein
MAQRDHERHPHVTGCAHEGNSCPKRVLLDNFLARLSAILVFRAELWVQQARRPVILTEDFCDIPQSHPEYDIHIFLQ